MSSIKERALIEPLVDNVDPEQIATNSHQIKTIDILNMKVEDANFEVAQAASSDTMAILIQPCSCFYTRLYTTSTCSVCHANRKRICLAW